MSLRHFKVVLLAASLALSVRVGAQPRPDTLRVGIVFSEPARRDSPATAIGRGIDLGMEEARRSAALFGLVFEVVPAHAFTVLPLRAARPDLGRVVDAIIVARDRDECAIAADAATSAVVVFTLDCTPTIDATRPCERRVFQIAPTAVTHRRAQDAVIRGRGGDQPAESRIVLWHHTLSRFGAEQLNERFRRHFGAEMDSPAWSAWVAMKILTEAALRAPAARGAEIARYLRQPGARFDGHKGEPLTFDARTGELRQPLYSIAGRGQDERVTAEVRSPSIFLASVPLECEGGDV